MAEAELDAIAAEHAIRRSVEQVLEQCLKLKLKPVIVIGRGLTDDSLQFLDDGTEHPAVLLGALRESMARVWACATEDERHEILAAKVQLVQGEAHDESLVEYLRRLMRELGIKDPTQDPDG